MQFFIFGAGYSGKAFGAAKAGEARIGGTTRSADKFPALKAANMEPFLFNAAMPAPEALAFLAESTHLIVSAAPNEGFDPVLAVMRDFLLNDMPRLRWIGYLSTVGVYGDHEGAWVDETSECHPVSLRSRQRVFAEQEWLTFAKEKNVALAILRLSGIYGPGRNALVNLHEGTARRLVKKDQVFNRIHVEDIAGALWHLASKDQGGIFNVTDNEPAPPQDVVTFAAGLANIPPPPEQAFEEVELPPLARSFYGENKRVSNARIRDDGYVFRHPDYKTTFKAMWADGGWKGEAGDGRSPILKR